MAITSFDPRNPRIVPANGVPQIVQNLLEANSQSFKAGELVQLASGAVSVAAAGDAPVMGIALADATNVSASNASIPVMIIKPDDEVFIQVSDGSGSLETATTTCKAGVAYDIEVTSGLHTLASDDTTNPKFVFIDAIYDAAGSAGYWARVRPYYLENQPTAG